MVSINGISLKSVRTFEGAEGTGFSANIFIDGKKIGSVLDDAWGGSYVYNYDSKEGEDLLYSRLKEWYDKHPEDDFKFVSKLTAEEYRQKKDNGEIPKETWEEQVEYSDIFFSRLIDIIEYKKCYKKAVKKGFRGYAVYTYPYISGPKLFDKAYFIANKDQADVTLAEIQKEHVAFDMEYCFMDEKEFVM